MTREMLVRKFLKAYIDNQASYDTASDVIAELAREPEVVRYVTVLSMYQVNERDNLGELIIGSPEEYYASAQTAAVESTIWQLIESWMNES